MANAAAAGGGLLLLPPELVDGITAHLTNCDIKYLRLTCRHMAAQAVLRLQRVFLSAHPLDVEVFRSIADHDTLRERVTEIIWDDAVFRMPRLMDAPFRGLIMPHMQPAQRDTPAYREEKRKALFQLYRAACIEEVNGVKALEEEYDIFEDIDLEDRFPPSDHWCKRPIVIDKDAMSTYKQIRASQTQVMARGEPVSALRYGLVRFPALRRITVTPAAHGTVLGRPLYHTPTIRALPPGFVYPLPEGWLRTKLCQGKRLLPEWVDDGEGDDAETWRGSFVDYLFHTLANHTRDLWPGVRTVLDVLADGVRGGQDGPICVPELVFDAHGLDTGVNCRMFSSGHRAYDNLRTILAQPGFRRLELALATGRPDNESGLPPYGFLEHGRQHGATTIAAEAAAVGHALGVIGPDLEHLRVTTDALCGSEQGMPIPRQAQEALRAVLRAVFPPDVGRRWPRLRHLALCGFFVTQADLQALLRELPPTLETLELGELLFLDPSDSGPGSWKQTLEDMRETLGWRARPPNRRPRVSVWVRDYSNHRTPGRAVWVDEVIIEAYLYGDGGNPFRIPDVDEGLEELEAVGLDEDAGVVRDAFDPGFARRSAVFYEFDRGG